MSKPAKKTTDVKTESNPLPSPQSEPGYYTIKRVRGGFAIFQDEKQVTAEDMWAIALNQLGQMLRKDLGL